MSFSFSIALCFRGIFSPGGCSRGWAGIRLGLCLGGGVSSTCASILKSCWCICWELHPQFTRGLSTLASMVFLSSSCYEGSEVQRAGDDCVGSPCVHGLSDCLLISLKWLKAHDTWLWGFLFNLLVNVMCEINLAADWSSLFAGSEKRHAGYMQKQTVGKWALRKTQITFFFFVSPFFLQTAQKQRNYMVQFTSDLQDELSVG